MTSPPFIIAVILIGLLSTVSAEADESDSEMIELTEANDALLSAITSNDTVALERLLSGGANPNASSGEPRHGHSLCLAAEPGREASLRLLLKHGAEADRLYGDNHSYGSPLACAITRGSFSAFEILLDAGASPGLDVCTFCDYEINTGPAEVALVSQRYRELWRLIELDAVNERALDDIVYALEQYPAFGDEVVDPYRRKLVEWLEAQGTALDLRTPLPDRATSR